MICPAISNCWPTMALIPAGLACLITERILVPKMRFVLALSAGSKLGHGFHQLDPILFSDKALVHFQKRHNPFHVPEIVRRRLSFDSCPWCSRTRCSQNSLAVESGTGDDPGAHLVHHANISSSLDQASFGFRRDRGALGVLPPLWSSAAIKPGPVLIFCNCSLFMSRVVITPPSIVGSG